uniref:Uncharacterized protein n=1 Tax=Eutreptiella gymnastica TaxID=73025 RepID=A0A7S1NQT2_9EUGL
MTGLTGLNRPSARCSPGDREVRQSHWASMTAMRCLSLCVRLIHLSSSTWTADGPSWSYASSGDRPHDPLRTELLRSVGLPGLARCEGIVHSDQLLESVLRAT